MRLFIVTRTDAELLLEGAGEMMDIGESHGGGNLRDIHIRVAEQLFRLAYFK